MSVFGINFSYQVRGASGRLAMHQLATAFERSGAEMVRYGEHVFPPLIRLLQNEVRGQFKAEGRGPNRGPWAALSPRYAEWKAKHYPGKSILRRTDRLYNALTRSRSGGALRHYGPKELRFGTMGVPYASVHQAGSGGGVLGAIVGAFTGRKGTPDRPFFDFTKDFDTKLLRVAKGAALAAVKKHARQFASFRDDSALDNRLDFLLAGDD